MKPTNLNSVLTKCTHASLLQTVLEDSTSPQKESILKNVSKQLKA